MKKISVCTLAFVMLFLSILCIGASAQASEVIDSAGIAIVVNTDGTADVTENWVVSYISDSAGPFIRNIDMYNGNGNISLLQKFDKVTDVGVMINDKEITTSGDSEKYSVNEKDGSIEIAVSTVSKAKSTKKYVLEYTLEGAVKEKGKNAAFDFMALGKTFLYTANNVTITVFFPETADASSIAVPEGYDAEIKNGSVTFFSKRVFDTFDVSASCDASIFEDGALASYSSAKDSLVKAGNFLSSVMPYIIAFVAAVLVILFVLLPEKLVRFPLEKQVKNAFRKGNKERYEDIPENETACSIYKMTTPVSRISPKKTSKKVTSVFAMAVLECMEKGYIIEQDDKLIVGVPANEEKPYIMSVINFLRSFSEKSGNRCVIDRSFAESVNAECSAKYDLIANYLASFYKLVPSVGIGFINKNRAQYKKAYALKLRAHDVKHKPSFAECMKKISEGSKTTDAEVFALMFTSNAEKLFAHDGNEGEKALCTAIHSMHNVFVKSK